MRNVISLEMSQVNDQEFKSLGDRMKEYEQTSASLNTVPPHLPYILRLDGSCFSKFTKGFAKPFDAGFAEAMVQTMNDLVHHLSAKTGYTHSDEITLIYDSCCTDKMLTVHRYNGRVQKLCSTAAAYCSVRFNYHLLKIVKENYPPKIIDKVSRMEAFFDCRVIVFPEDKPQEIVNHMIWRSMYDCFRNTVQAYAHHHFPSKVLFKKNCHEMIEMLQKEKNLNWDDVPLAHKHGTYGKKENYEKEGATRSRVSNRSFIIKCTSEFQELLFAKTWPSATTAATTV